MKVILNNTVIIVIERHWCPNCTRKQVVYIRSKQYFQCQKCKRIYTKDSTGRFIGVKK